MTLTRRERLREATIEEIKQIARQQMAKRGAAALSLRAIAREMGMTAPALYRYFKNRDALVTALIVDAYNSLADALEKAHDAHPPGDHAGCFLSTAMAYRDWALAHPEDYNLIFGSPIPDYHAPEEITTPPAKRSFGLFVGILETALEDGQLVIPPEYARLPPQLQESLENLRKEREYTASVSLLFLAIVGWGLLHGLVSLELYQHLRNMVDDVGDIYRTEMRAWMKRLDFEVG